MDINSINIRHHLILFLGSNRKLYKEIDKIYNSNESKYYLSYKNSKYFNDIVKQKKSTLVESYINKVIGIVEDAYNNEDLTNIMKLIQKGYGKIYKFFKNAKTVDYTNISNQVFTEKFSLENDENFIYGHLIVMIYLSHVLNVNIINFDSEQFLIPYVEHFYLTLASKDLLLKNNLNKEKLTDLYMKLDIDTTEINKNLISLNVLLENMIDRKAVNLAVEDLDKKNFNVEIKTNDKKLKNSQRKQKELLIKSTPMFFDFREKVFQDGIYKYIGVYSQWLDVIGIDSTDIFIDTMINKDIFDLILYQIYNSLGVGQIEPCDIENTFVSLLYIYNLTEVYKQTKKLYLDESKEELFSKLIEKEKYINQKEETIKEDLTIINNIKTTSEKEIQNLKEEIELLKKQNKFLKDEASLQNSYEKEVISLRNYVYENKVNTEHLDLDNISYGDKIKHINSKNITIFGGHPVWSKKLKDRGLNIKFIGTDMLHIKLSFLSKMDLVIFTTNYLSHSMYKKVIKSNYIDEVSIGYVDDVNINQAIDKIYYLCK